MSKMRICEYNKNYLNNKLMIKNNLITILVYVKLFKKYF